jgi:RNA polymerase sigma factor (sigma-70 family)
MDAMTIRTPLKPIPIKRISTNPDSKKAILIPVTPPILEYFISADPSWLKAMIDMIVITIPMMSLHTLISFCRSLIMLFPTRTENAVIPIDAAIHSNLRQTTTKIFSSLTPREERVLRMRFGIGMNSDHTLEEVGQQFSVTRERIRQIEAKAPRKLKHPTRAKQLKSFLDKN